MSDKLDKIFKELGFTEPPPPAGRPELNWVPPKKGECGKSCYCSEARVRQAIRAMLRHKRGDTSWLRPYFCQACGCWHMTAMRKN